MKGLFSNEMNKEMNNEMNNEVSGLKHILIQERISYDEIIND